MKSVARLAILSAIVSGFNSTASAAIFGVPVEIFSEASTTPPIGFRSHALSVTSTTDWTAAQLVVNLVTGSIYQDAAANEGTGAAPNPAFFPFVPTLRWDTYVTGWAPYQPASSAGGAVDIGGGAAAFSTSAISKQWFTTDINDIGTSTIGRLTLSNTANGTFKMLLQDSGGQNWTITMEIMGGGFMPEPSSIIILGLSIPIWFVALRRKMM